MNLSGCWIARSRVLLLCMLAGLVAGIALWKPVRVLAEEAAGDVSFRWAFVTKPAGEENAQPEVVAEDAVLKTGDRLKILVEPQSGCYVYVVYHSAQDELKMLFSYDEQKMDSGDSEPRMHFIPQGDAWFRLDENVGRETFFLLASAERLTTIEDLFRQYESSAGDAGSQIGKQILLEIEDRLKQHRDLSSPAERPVPIGGAIRSIDSREASSAEEIASLGREVTAKGFYGRVFTIEHK